MTPSTRVATRFLPLALLLGVGLLLDPPGPATAAPPQDSITIHRVNTGGAGDSHATIQEAVDHAERGETVRVGPGVYTESVEIREKLEILGAKAGVDARGRTPGSAGESIVNHPEGGFRVLDFAFKVTIDGFSIEDASGVNQNARGIFLTAGGGNRIVNNIFRNNSMGLFFSAFGPERTTIRRNLFLNNNNTAPGIGGNGIFGGLSAVFNTLIADNDFQGHTNSAISIFPGEGGGVTIARNRTQGDARLLEIFNTNRTLVCQNTGTGFTDDAIFVGPDNPRITIDGNTFTGGSERGIFIDKPFPGLASQAAKIRNNRISDMMLSGIEAGQDALVDGKIRNNRISNSGADGIRMGSGSTGNHIIRNRIQASTEHDAHDESVGGGTAGTGNFWQNNSCTTAQPPALCP